MVKSRPSLSLLTAIALWAALAFASLLNRPSFLFGWDSFGYHLYLPAFFVQHDPLVHDVAWAEQARASYDASGTLYQLSTLPDGTRVPKYTMGLAVLWAPWFLIGHAFAHITGAAADGYSTPYQLAVHAGMLMYLLCGLLALRRVLSALFTERAASITLVLLFLATNLLDQVLAGPGMPHLPLFCLYALILFFTREWSMDRSVRKALPLAVVMGLAMLVRPSEAVCLLIPFLWAPDSEHANPFVRMWRSRKQWGLISLVLFIVGLPQFLYWQAATGHWFVDTYNNAGEGFDLLEPHTGKFLFSFRKGWYLYTPLMLVATGGILLLRRHAKAAFLPVLCFFLANLFLLSSWTCWWYADSFGSRAMTGSYAVMALPLAAVFHRVRTRHRTWRISVAIAIIGICALNLFQYWQFRKGIIHSSRMTRTAYMLAFGSTEIPADFENALLVHRSYSGTQDAPDVTRYTSKVLPTALIDPPSSPADTLLTDTGGRSRRAFKLLGADAFTPAVRVPFHQLTQLDHAWIEAEWRVKVSGRPFQGSFVNTMEHTGRSYAYDGRNLEPFDPKPGDWTTIRTWYLTPEVRSVQDVFACYFWSRDTSRILVEGPVITVHEPLMNP